MKQFMADDFLLKTETAKTLFNNYAMSVPIIDYHCHINPKEIAQDKSFDSITQVWLGGDHYKWRLMRSNGIDEHYITGKASDREKFQKWAETVEVIIGNPVLHWSHLELQRFFGYNGVLNSKTAEDVWNICNAKLRESSMSVRNMIKNSNVKIICTTDDPIDSLEYHKAIKEDSSFDVQVLPAWRPDKAMNIEKPDYFSYLDRLSEVSGIKINDYSSLKAALINRMEFFDSMGCNVSDHALEYVMFYPAPDEEIEKIFEKRKTSALTKEEELKFKTAFMLFVSREYNKMDWALQLHYGCKRDNNTLMFEKLGPDTGYDCIANYAPSPQMADFLNALNKTNELPRTVIYSLNPNDNAAIVSILGCFQNSSAVGKIQHGSAWWFNDHLDGMTEQIKTLGSMGLLSGFVGMLTDSRSFLSYPRHEYFRRILCNIIGDWIENGEFPNDLDTAGKIVKNISYNNALNYFKFKV